MLARTVVWTGVCSCVLFALTPGCSNQSRYEPTGNGLIDMRNPDLLLDDRVAAAESAWAEVLAGERDRARTRQALKNLAWSRATPGPLRYTALDLLMSDPSPEGSADSARMARLILPTETDRQAVRIILTHTIRQGWERGMLPAIVRAYARRDPGVPDSERMEQRALESLVPGASVEEIVFRVFLDPLAGDETSDEHAILRTAQRTRDDAWGLLARLDPDESMRRRLVRSTESFGELSAGARETISDLRACDEDFGIIPDLALELAWLRHLRRAPDPDWVRRNTAWWDACRSAFAALTTDQKRGIELRHLEPVRWASEHSPVWLSMDRAGLLEELASRLRGRLVHKRDADPGEPPRRERLSDWRDTLVWGDALALLIADEAVRARRVVDAIDLQASLDKKDTSTEYGGIIDSDDDGRFRAVLFRPRSRDRVSDTRFVASEDMMRFSDRALAHYHFHANERNNADYAGPSLADLENAQVSGRTSIVLTSIKEDELNVDVYFPTGAVVDLGVIRRP